MDQIRKDFYLLFGGRILRMFAYGSISVVLILYLSEIGLNDYQIGLLLTLTLIGDFIVSLWITTHADFLGRRIMLIAGAVLMIIGGLVFLLTKDYLILVAAAIIGVISPSGKEIGPFLSIEQAGLTQLLESKNFVKVFAWYNLAGSFAAALGSLSAGWLSELLQAVEFNKENSYKAILAFYVFAGILLSIIFYYLSANIELAEGTEKELKGKMLGLHKSKKVVIKLSTLFALDSFAGGLIIQSIIAYWFFLRFDAEIGTLGTIFFGVNIIAGISALFAVQISKKIGLLNTMVFTHLPSNILLIIIPLMPSLESAVILLLLRFSISQMDVPTRQAYTMGVVSPDERSAASGITTITRSIGASISPSLSGIFLANPFLINFPFFIAGGLKIIYDLWLYFSLRKIS
ncbi:MAG TPA: MFS transporter [Ignavibacteriaceae bacterium]|nr:MFS transporter [Ignavibacteriaceae bacterium]